MMHDPGGKIRFQLQPGMIGRAYFSDCQRYRYALHRIWKVQDPIIMWIGMNPSTADEMVDDPTVRREINFSKAYGFGRYIKLNVMAYRATDPKDLLEVADPVGPRNMEAILGWANKAHAIVAAWGALPKVFAPHAAAVERALRDAGHTLECIGLSKAGHPRHPLYMPNSSVLMPYKGVPE
jgi:hypothetical protein